MLNTIDLEGVCEFVISSAQVKVARESRAWYQNSIQQLL